MTTLAITPNYDRKTARFKGTVAAGEHVEVTIANDGMAVADTASLRLRVVDFDGRTLAQFPMPEKEEVLPSFEAPEETEETVGTEETGDAWDEDLTPLKCTLNLNTVQMLRAVPPGANVQLWWVLDDYENKTLYFKEMFSVEHWPRRRGEEEPVDLDDYADLIKDFTERLEDAETTVSNAAEQATTAAQRVSEALTEEGHFRDSASAYASAAQTSATAAGNARNDAQTAERNAEGHKNAAATSASNAAAAKAAAEEAAAEAQAALPLDKTLAKENKAAEAKSVGDAVRTEKQRAENAEGSLGGRIDAEAQARALLAATVQTNTANIAMNTATLENKADRATTYTKTEVDAKVAAATPSDYDSVKARLATAEGKIPAQASSQNQLADKAFVNSSVATATATFRGTSAAATQEAFDAWLAGLTADENDYVFWRTVDAYGNAVFKRYKYNGEAWEWEFDLNNSSFTAEQWAAISSGITSGLVAKLGALPTAAELATALAGKQNALTFDSGPTAGSTNPAMSGGIWSAIWGALAALPAGFSSLYDWCVSRLAVKRGKDDLAVYRKVGVGETWTLVGQDGITTTNVVGVFSDWGDGIGNWGFFIDGVSVAGSDTAYRSDDYEGVQWVGGDEVGYTGTASRPFAFQPVTGDALAKLSELPTASSISPSMDGTATPGSSAAFARADHVHPSDPSKVLKTDIESLLFAQYYPDGSVTSAAEFTDGIKYAFDTANRTATVKPFCNTGTAADDNSDLVGRVVIPPFVDAQGHPYITGDGEKYKVIAVGGSFKALTPNTLLTEIVAPTTVTDRVGYAAFGACSALTSVSLPAATRFDARVFDSCSALTSVSLPAATILGGSLFDSCSSLASVSLPAAMTLYVALFRDCSSLASVDFGNTVRSSIPAFGDEMFDNVPTSCKIIVPYAQYDSWRTAPGWSLLDQEFLRHAEKADKPLASYAAGNVAALDAAGNLVDSQVPAANVAEKSAIRYTLVAQTITNEAVSLDDRAINAVSISSAILTLTVNFPAATGQVRDFALRLTCAAGVTAPELEFPQGVTLENSGGVVPAIAGDDGTTILYFTETAANTFLLKSEVLDVIA